MVRPSTETVEPSKYPLIRREETEPPAVVERGRDTFLTLFLDSAEARGQSHNGVRDSVLSVFID